MKDTLLTLYDYNYWANARLFDAAAKLDEAQFLAPAAYPHGGVRGSMEDRKIGGLQGWRIGQHTPDFQPSSPAILQAADFTAVRFMSFLPSTRFYA